MAHLNLNWDGIDYGTFEILCDDTVRALLPAERRGTYVVTHMAHHRDFQRDGMIESGGLPFFHLDSPVVVSCKRTDTNQKPGDASKAIRALFLDKRGFDRLIGWKPKSVILFSNVDLTEIDKEAIRKTVAGRFIILFQDRKELEQRFREHPHLLWKYFKQSWQLETYLSSDLGGLRDALLNNPLADKVPLDRLKHRAVEALDPTRMKHLRIVGKPGSGKSVALWQLLPLLEETEVVILRSLDLQLNWPQLSEVLLQTQPSVTVVLDNLHELVTMHPGVDLLSRLSDLAQSASTAVRVLVAYRSTERTVVERAILPDQWRKWEFAEVSLDDPPDVYIGNLISLTCEVLRIRIDDSIRQAWVRHVADWENTPACVVSSLLPYAGKHMMEGFFPVELKERESLWRGAFGRLIENQRGADVDALKTLSALRASGQPASNESVVREVFHLVSGRPEGELDQALHRLENDGWVRRKDCKIAGHDVQIMPASVDLIVDGQPSAWLETYRKMLQARQFEPLNQDWAQCLTSLSRLYWDAGHVKVAEELNDKVLRDCPKNVRALCNRGVCRIRQGKHKQGIADLADAVMAAPEDFGPVRMLYFALWRIGRRKEASAVLAARVELSLDDPRVLEFAALALAGDKKLGLQIAMRLWKLRKDAVSASILAGAYRFAGRKDRSLRLVRAATQRWPESGRLHVVACEGLRAAGRVQEALQHGKQAVVLSPNGPESYVVLAWLQVQLGDYDDAENTIASARVLVPKHPGVQAINGMLLVYRDKLQEGEQALLAAVDQRERMPDEMLCNVYLSLGEVQLRNGKDEDAGRSFALAREHGVDKGFCMYRKAQALQDMKRLKEAAALFRRLVKDKRVRREVLWRLAAIYSATGDYGRLAEVLRSVLRTDPDDANALAELVETEIGHLKRYKSALRHARRLASCAPNESRSWELLAAALLYTHKYQEAMRNFDKVIASEQTHQKAWYGKARCLQALGRHKEAVDCFLRARELGPRRFDREPSALICLADSLAEDERRTQAVEFYKRAADLDPQSVRALYGLGESLAVLEDYQQAVEHLESVTRMAPDHKHAWFIKAQALKKLGRHESAAEALNHAFGASTPDEILWLSSAERAQQAFVDAHLVGKVAEELVQDIPASLAALGVCSRLRYALGNFEGVVESCDRILTRDQTRSDILLLKVRALNRAARRHDAQSESERSRWLALESARKLVAVNPFSPGAQLQLIAACASGGREHEALEVFGCLSDGADADADDWAMAGFALGETRHPAEALRAFEHALRLKPEVPAFLSWKAQALGDLERLEEARSVLNEALRLAPQNPLIAEQSVRLWLRVGAREKAVKECRRALRRYPKSAKLHELLAVASDDTAESKKHFRRALAIEPSRVVSLKQLGIIESTAGELEAAVEHLRKAVALAPADSETRVILAQMLVQIGKHDDARNEYEATLQVSPTPFVRHLYATLLESLGDETNAQAQREEAVRSVDIDVRQHEAMAETLIQASMFEAAVMHITRLTELDPANADYHLWYANCLSKLDRRDEGEKHYQEALKLDDSSFQVHCDYAAHLAKSKQGEKAADQFAKAWNIAVTRPEKDLGILVNLANVAFSIGYTHVIVPVLETLMDEAKGKDDDVYSQTMTKILDMESFLIGEVAGSTGSPQTASWCQYFAGRLKKARGDLVGAREQFRGAARVSVEARMANALVEWCNLLLIESGKEVSDALLEEVREAVKAVAESAAQQGVDESTKDQLDAVRSRLLSLLDSIR